MTKRTHTDDSNEPDEQAPEEAPEETPEETPEQDDDAAAITQAAKDCLEGKYGSGRERDLELAKAGFDPEKVRKEYVRLRAELAQS